MKGKIEKHHNFFNTKEKYYRIGYKYGAFGERFMDINAEDMPEFMDDIMSAYMELEGIEDIREPVRETALELIERARDKCLKEIGRDVVKVITKQEEAEQDIDELEMDSETKTHNNFPTNEALDFDVNVRERV